MFVLASGAAMVYGQSVEFAGQVLDQQTKEPVTGANVYIGGTTQGSITDLDGRFSFSASILESAELVVSFVGYHSVSLPVHPQNAGQYTELSIELEQASIDLGDVVVSADNSQWMRHFQRFRSEFLGQNEFAEKAVIENRWVLDFVQKANGELLATAAEPIVIRNHALGYVVTAALGKFEWALTARTGFLSMHLNFEEMVPVNRSQMREWQSNRSKAYEGSLRHFLKSLFNGEHRRERFTVVEKDGSRAAHIIELEQSLPVARLLLRYNLPASALNRDVKAFATHGPVDVLYGREPATRMDIDRRTRSALVPQHRERVFLVRKDGTLVDPGDVGIQGVWSTHRLAHQLPPDFEP
ncbi:MAG: carboxypeptidase-like regulatory domain-containing protein [Balneolaceae bacterium]